MAMKKLMLMIPFLTRNQDLSYPVLLKAYGGEEIMNFALSK